MKGQVEVEEPGSPARATSITRTVYDENGKVLHDETWNTSYRGEYKVVRVGTKKPPEPRPEPKPKPAPKTTPPPTETAPTTTTTTTTRP
jgi:hypothetical protein